MNTSTQTSADKGRIQQAIAETGALLNKATSYAPEFQKQAQIDFYVAHIKYLSALADGLQAIPPTADLENWDVTNCVRDARASSPDQGSNK
jgi:hypothetical protein